MSLSNQLKKIASNNPFKQALLHQRQRPSLLFDGKQAADIDLDTIYAMGINGLLELKTFDARFDEFEQTLFSESMKSFDRTRKTPEENKKLDASIDNFLRLVSPFLLLKPASKALEWLIRRYQIQDFSVDAVMSCILPYHETNIFIKFMSMIDFSSNSRWKFLEPIAKKGVPLDRPALIEHAKRDPGILKFVCEAILTAQKTGTLHKTLVSFGTAFILQYVQQVNQVTENVLLVIMPFVLQFLDSQDERCDLHIAALMIISQLASRANFSHVLCTSTLEHATRNKSLQIQDLLLCALVLVQTQEALRDIPLKAAQYICSNNEFISAVQLLAQEYDLNKFLHLLINSLAFEKGIYENSDLIKCMVEKLSIPDEIVLTIAERCLAMLQHDTDLSQEIKNLFRIIQLRHCTIVDSLIKKELSNAQDEGSRNALLSIVTGEFLGGQSSFEDARLTVSLSLQHPEKHIRLIGVQKLFDLNFKDPETLEFIRDSLILRLEDEDDEVIDFIVCHKNLSSILSDTDYLRLFLELTSRKISDKVRAHAIHRFQSVLLVEQDMKELIKALLPYVIPTEKTKQTSLAVYSVLKHYHNDSLLQGADTLSIDKETTEDGLQATCADVVKMLAANCENNLNVWEEYFLNGNRLVRILCSLVFGECMIRQPSQKVAHIAGSLISNTRVTQVSIEDKTKIIAAFWKNSKSENLESIAHAHCMSSIIEHLPPPKMQTVWLKSLSSASDETKSYMITLCLIYSFVTSCPVGIRTTLMNALLNKHLNASVLEFLVSITCLPLTEQNEDVIVPTLSLLQRSVSCQSGYDGQWCIAYLLPLLRSPYQQIRYHALKCLTDLERETSKDSSEKKKNKKRLNLFGSEEESIKLLPAKYIQPLLKMINVRRSEILTDPVTIKQIIKELFSHKNLKQDTYSELLASLFSHVAFCDIPGYRLNMLRLFDGLNAEAKLKASFVIMQKNADKMERSLTADGAIGLSENEQEIQKLAYGCLLSSNVLKLESKSSFKGSFFGQFKLYKNSGNRVNLPYQAAYDELLAAFLHQLTPSFFEEFEQDNQKKIVSFLIDFLVTGSQKIIKTTRKCLTQLRIPVDIIIGELAFALNGMSSGKSSSNEPPSKKISTTEQMKSISSTFYHRILAIMELLQGKDNIVDEKKLIPVAFEVLAVLLQVEPGNITSHSLEYMKQLILTFLLRVLTQNNDRKGQLEESEFRVDLLVQCIRLTDNPQTHNHALLLLATAGSIFPNKVLHNIMPIFTFMGANVMRQDDNYSFYVIQQTIERIIPPLIESRQQVTASVDDFILSVKDILQVFNNALFHVPKHRRLRLMAILISTFNPDPFLYAITIMMLARYSSNDIAYPKQEVEPVNQFAISLLNQFDVTIQVSTVQKMINWIMMSENGHPEMLELIDERSVTKKVLDSQINISKFVSTFLDSQSFSAALTLHRANFDENLEKSFLSLVEVLLKAIQVFGKQRKTDIVENLCSIIDKINNLLSVKVFTVIVNDLLNSDDHIVRIKALSLFSKRLQKYSESNTKETADLDHFISIVEKLKDVLITEETVNNKVVALTCAAQLFKEFAQSHASTLISLLPAISGDTCLKSSNINLQTASLACLATAIEALGPRSLTVLNDSIKVAAQLVLDADEAAASVSCKHAALTLIENAIKTLPQFCSPHLETILRCVFKPDIIEASGKKKQISEVALSISSSIAIKVPARILIQPLLAFFPKTVQYGPSSIYAYFSTLRQVLNQLNQEMILKTYKQIFKFFLNAFDFRAVHSLNEEFTVQEIDQVEKCAVDAFIEIVMKLNETLFKPLFLKMVDWAFVESSEHSYQRQIFFYQLMDSFLNRLKSIFAPYYTYLLDYSIATLTQCASEQQVDEVWKPMMRSLQKCLMYDNDGFLSEDNLKSLLKPLVDQLGIISEDADVEGDEGDDEREQYIKRMQDFVIPCLGQLALTSRQDAILKPLNQAVLMKTRDENASVRLAALKTVQEFYNKMGDDFLVYLPETIPFLAELLEDDDEQVEKCTRQVIRLIEEYLGESLQEHLK